MHGVAIDQQNSLFYLAIYNNGYYKGYLGIDESDSNRFGYVQDPESD